MEKITDKIKSFEDACKHLGLNPNDLPVVDMLPEKDRKSIIAFYKLTIIIRALNEGWEPDWSNWDEWKYYNWFYVEKGEDQRSSGFRYNDTNYTNTNTNTSSQLCRKIKTGKDLATRQKITEMFKGVSKKFRTLPKKPANEKNRKPVRENLRH